MGMATSRRGFFSLLLCVGFVCWLSLDSKVCGQETTPRLRKKNNNRKQSKRFHNSLAIHYPLQFFASGNNQRQSWRKSLHFDKEFVYEHQEKKSWLEESHAQDGEDVWLYENWFYGMRHGVIMESGALDGILFSTSYMFETFANWTALHVEADPENFGNLRMNRDNAINVHCALCSEPQLLHYSSEGVVPVRGFVEFMAPSFIKKWHKNLHNNRTKLEDLPTVQCVTVKALLQEMNINHVDIWILDTEGAEESVLRGTDFQQVHFNAIAMECDEHDVVKNARKTDILEANGFDCFLVERNCMCKHKQFTPSSSPNKSLLRKWDGQRWTDAYNGTIVQK